MNYEKALELIEKEIQEKTGVLDLNQMNLTGFPRFITELAHLTYLDLSYNHIQNINLVKKLHNLKSLDIVSNPIEDFSPLENLPHLESLSIGQATIGNFDFLKRLKKLKSLTIVSTNISDYSFFGHLSELTHLALLMINIDYSLFEYLPNLKRLQLSYCKTSNIDFLQYTTNLNWLNLSFNKIIDITPITNLPELTSLNLESNEISDLRPLKNLSNLVQIDIDTNKIVDINPLLPHIINGTPVSLEAHDWRNDNKIYIANNPITNPPLEIVRQGNDAILRYFAEKEKGSQKLMEAKLLIVGQGGAGKTSLKRKLHDVNDKMPEPEDTTRGIDVTQLDCKTNNGEDFRLNIWDFGGQNVQHYAHQFFLTGSSLYALVTNEREQNPNFQYWLNIIEMLGGKSPVLIVQNEIAGHSEPIKNAAAIRERFENVVNPFQQVDLSKASSDGRFKNLKEAIIHHALQLPHIGKEYPTSYVRVREALEREAKEKHYITWKEYQELCRTAQVDDPDVMQDIATTFTILGVCLHFKDDMVLKKYVFLNPKWIIDALFELLYHQLVIDQQGQFSENDLARIWSHDMYDDMEDKLIRIMENFELCYRIKDSRHYIVPQRLPAEQQTYGWQEPQATRVEYDYKFMPKGIITRLTCRLHEKIEEDHVWNDAVIFEMPKARAFVREVYAEEKIAIEVSGEKRADLLNRILDEVDDIHRKSNYANLQVEKKVPCSCAVCIGSKVPYFFNYDYLVELLDDGEYDERCQVSRKKVDIREVLLKTGIDFKKDRKAGRMEFWNDLEQDGLQKEAEILIKKLNHLRAEKAKSSDAAQIFTLDRQIEEAEKRLAEIRTAE